MPSPVSLLFPRYTAFEPRVPVWCVTPEDRRVIHRFYDTSPFSPSGRLLALTRLPDEDRLPRPGDVAEVVVVDLETAESRTVAETRGWDTQLGAQVQWGADDTQLFFNDLDTRTWRPFGVRLDPATGARRTLGGPVYNVSLDGRWSASPCLLRTARTQPGYGVIVPANRIPANSGLPDDDGLYLTDLETGECRLAISIREIAERARAVGHRLPGPEAGDCYGFHAKWNPQGTRLLINLRWVPRPGLWDRLRGRAVSKSDMMKSVITLEWTGAEIGAVHVAISHADWARGGHHPNWCPDGEHVIMNLNLGGEGLRFVTARHDGSDLRALHHTAPGSGHPTLHPDGRHVLTDAYPGEPVAFGDGTIPLRLLDLDRGREEVLVRIHTAPPFRGPRKELRVDAHPAWDRTARHIAFNACPDGTRRVYVADLGECL